MASFQGKSDWQDFVTDAISVHDNPIGQHVLAPFQMYLTGMFCLLEMPLDMHMSVVRAFT